MGPKFSPDSSKSSMQYNSAQNAIMEGKSSMDVMMASDMPTKRSCASRAPPTCRASWAGSSLALPTGSLPPAIVRPPDAAAAAAVEVVVVAAVADEAVAAAPWVGSQEAALPPPPAGALPGRHSVALFLKKLVLACLVFKSSTSRLDAPGMPTGESDSTFRASRLTSW
jgi:hypothetical protein